MINAALVAAAIAMPQSQALTSLENDFDVALGTIGMTTRTARFDSNILGFFGSTRFTTPFYKAVHENPWRMPYFAETFRREFSAAAGKPHDSMDVGLRLVGFGTRRTLIGSPIAYAEDVAKKNDGLSSVLTNLKASGVIKGEIPALTGVPQDVQNAAALILSTISRSVVYRRMAVKDLGAVDDAYLFLATNGRDDLEGENQDRMERMAKSVDLS